jgi:hypothetical protein
MTVLGREEQIAVIRPYSNPAEFKMVAVKGNTQRFVLIFTF